MPRLEFHLLADSEASRRVRRGRRLRGAGLACLAVAAGALLWTAGAASPPRQGVSAPRWPAARMPRARLPAFGNYRVIVVADNSSSTDSFAAERQRQIEQVMRTSEVLGAPVMVSGYAIAPAGAAWNALPELLRACDHPRAQAVWFITDFNGGDDEGNDAGSLRELAATLRRRQVRLYISTMNQPPPGEYIAVADSSGGGLVTLDR